MEGFWRFCAPPPHGLTWGLAHADPFLQTGRSATQSPARGTKADPKGWSDAQTIKFLEAVGVVLPRCACVPACRALSVLFEWAAPCVTLLAVGPLPAYLPRLSSLLLATPRAGIDATQFEEDGVSAEVLLALSEEDLMTLGSGKVQARLLVAELVALKQGLTLEVEASDQTVAAAATVLLRRLGDDDHEVRASAIAQLEKCKLNDRRAVSPVAAKLLDPHPAVRRAAAGALGAIAEKSDRRAIESITKSLRDPDVLVRRAGLESLAALLEPGDRNLPLANAVLGVLEDRDIRVRASAVKVLGKFKKSDEDVLWGIRHKMTHGAAYTRLTRARTHIHTHGDYSIIHR